MPRDSLALVDHGRGQHPGGDHRELVDGRPRARRRSGRRSRRPGRRSRRRHRTAAASTVFLATTLRGLVELHLPELGGVFGERGDGDLQPGRDGTADVLPGLVDHVERGRRTECHDDTGRPRPSRSRRARWRSGRCRPRGGCPSARAARSGRQAPAPRARNPGERVGQQAAQGGRTEGTVEQMQTPSSKGSPAASSNPVSRKRHSSAVRLRSVESSQRRRSTMPSKSPTVVWVFSTSMQSRLTARGRLQTPAGRRTRRHQGRRQPRTPRAGSRSGRPRTPRSASWSAPRRRRTGRSRSG